MNGHPFTTKDTRGTKAKTCFTFVSIVALVVADAQV
jgi:hypothetical protein